MKHFPALCLFSTLALLAGCTSAPPPPPPPPAVAPAAKPARQSATTPPSASARPAAKPAAPTAQLKASPATATNAPAEPSAPDASSARPKLTAEAEAVVYRLTHAIGGNPAHELAETTGFPSALASLQTGAPAPKIENLGNVNLPPPKGLTADGNSTELVERDWTGLVLVPVNAALAKAYTTQVRLLKVEAHPLHDGRLRIWARVRNLGDRTLPAEIACSFRMRGETTPNSPYFYQLEVPSGAYRDVFFISPDGELSAYTVLVRSEEMWKQK